MHKFFFLFTLQALPRHGNVSSSLLTVSSSFRITLFNFAGVFWNCFVFWSHSNKEIWYNNSNYAKMHLVTNRSHSGTHYLKWFSFSSSPGRGPFVWCWQNQCFSRKDSSLNIDVEKHLMNISTNKYKSTLWNQNSQILSMRPDISLKCYSCRRE